MAILDPKPTCRPIRGNSANQGKQKKMTIRQKDLYGRIPHRYKGGIKTEQRTQEMARYILIDNNSGFIFGDTKNINCSRTFKNPAEAAKMLDESIGEPASEYVEIYGDHDTSGKSGYGVYSADDIEDMTEVEDGTDQATIDKFCRKCVRICFVETVRE